jgi:hypothetical protein
VTVAPEFWDDGGTSRGIVGAALNGTLAAEGIIQHGAGASG